MQSISESSIAALLKNKTVYLVRPERSQAPVESRRHEASDEITRTPKGRRRAAQMFRHEVHMRFKMRFSSSFEGGMRDAAESAPYRQANTSRGVATDLIQTARQIADNEPGRRSETIASLRESVREAGTAGLAAVDTGEERGAVRDTADLVSRGLDQIEEQPVGQRYDSLDVDARSKQRTSIRIRTQEGDVVRFDLRQVDKMSLSDVAESDGVASSQETNISVSSKSRLVLKVKGDLNEAELEAIRSVFATAESLADEFFAGDMSAALEIAAGLEFDSEQLARVSMRFRSVEQVRATQVSRVTNDAPQVEAPGDPAAAPETGPVSVPGPGPTDRPDILKPAVGAPVLTPLERDPVTLTPATDASPGVSDEAAPPAVSESAIAGAQVQEGGFGALLEYLGKLADYLEETTARFTSRFEFAADGQHMRFEMTESLQLEILRTVMTVKVPDEANAETESAGETIRELDVEAE